MMDSAQICLQVALNIRRARKETGMSQRELGRRLGYSNATISKIETGRRTLGIDELHRFARLTGKSLGFFLNGVLPHESQQDIVTELKTVERIVVPVWDRATLDKGGIVLCYAYFAPEKLKGRNIVGLQFTGVPLGNDIKNGDIIFFDTLSELSEGELVLALLNNVPVIMRCRRINAEVVLEYSGGSLSLNRADVKGVIIEMRRRLIKGL